MVVSSSKVTKEVGASFGYVPRNCLKETKIKSIIAAHTFVEFFLTTTTTKSKIQEVQNVYDSSSL